MNDFWIALYKYLATPIVFPLGVIYLFMLGCTILIFVFACVVDYRNARRYKRWEQAHTHAPGEDVLV